ncbi:DUF3019 domain-containing protein [Aliiglaciecola sp. LCG003]|uniref:DUF3019 domain-containing protein n=1 Tax=Aliiglaciecola sp. LCG003 TaxID=3053655 RepID=UPI002573D634|nr:DUF3019 domain-containing protein [Aliiglaciecola sp. LCG003]WJG09804.1 DUF3019 domain-containing protein [Aliiglaciecola sp. LCG003]
MYSNCKGIAVACLMILFHQGLYAQTLGDAQVKMVAQPNQCVALTQGRVCYAQVRINWTANASQSLCLADSQSSRILQCWKGQVKGEFIYEMESKEDVLLHLVVPPQETSNGKPEPLARTVIKVSWLYESNARKRRWRLF